MRKSIIAKHYVVFDGTSAYVCPFEDISDDFEILDKFDDFDEACKVCDLYNEKFFAN